MYVLYSILLYFSEHHSDIARPNIDIFLNSILWLLDVYFCELFGTTALLELGTHATPAITSAKYMYVTNKIGLVAGCGTKGQNAELSHTIQDMWFALVIGN